MGIIRVKKGRENTFTMVHNDILDTVELTWKAKGIMAYLLRLPDDWEFYEEELSKHAKDGLKSFKSGLKELIELGYVERTQLRNERGRFIGYEYCINEIPTESTKTVNGKMDNGKTVNRKRHTTNTDSINTDSTYTYDEEETIIKSYKNIKGRSVTKLERNKLLELLKTYSKDIILKAIEEMAIMADTPNIKYLQTTLDDWYSKGLQTIDLVEKHLAEREIQKTKVKQNRENAIKRAADNKPVIKKDRFNDYKQREYDYDDLEKKLLGWDKQEVEG